MPPASSGDAFECTGFGESQKQRYDLIISEARQKKAEAEKLYLTAAAFAREWQQHDACAFALHNLGQLYLEQANYKDSLSAFREVAKVQKLAGMKDHHPQVIGTYKMIGICHTKLRQLDKAIETLRDVVVRCQSSNDDILEEFVNSLCLLSHVYRLKHEPNRSRTCIRQAYAVVEDDDAPAELQIQVLEELAAVTYDQKRPKSAAVAFIRVLQLKRQTYGPLHPGCAETFLSLGMCYADLRNFKDAENCFIQALEIMRSSNAFDRAALGNALSKLGGIYHAVGNFVEANIIEQGASEIIGRAVDMRLGFFKQFDAGLSAQRRGHFDVAQSCYRQALVDLEAVFQKQAVTRVPILSRLFEIAEARNQKIAIRTLAVEIDEALLLLCAHDNVSASGKVLRLARLFRLLGFNEFSDSCYRYAEKLARRANDPELLPIFSEHALLLERMDPVDEVEKRKTLIRRVRRVCGVTPALPRQSAIEDGIDAHDVSQISFIADVLEGPTSE